MNIPFKGLFWQAGEKPFTYCVGLKARKGVMALFTVQYVQHEEGAPKISVH